MNIPSRWNSMLLAKVSKLPHYPMQIIVNFEIDVKSSRIQLKNFWLAVFCYRWLIGCPFRNANEIDIVLIAFPKIG